MDETLTKQDKTFVQELLETGNKTKAAKKAYKYKNNNTAGVMALDKLRKPKIQKAIKSIADSIDNRELIKTHKGLLRSTRLDHMVFPLGPKDEDDINFSGAKVTKATKEVIVDGEVIEGRQDIGERTTLTDKEIIDMLAEVNCKVRRIVHGETARHVYFWSVDNNARKNGLELGYKIKRLFDSENKASNVNIQVNILNYGNNAPPQIST